MNSAGRSLYPPGIREISRSLVVKHHQHFIQETSGCIGLRCNAVMPVLTRPTGPNHDSNERFPSKFQPGISCLPMKPFCLRSYSLNETTHCRLNDEAQGGAPSPLIAVPPRKYARRAGRLAWRTAGAGWRPRVHARGARRHAGSRMGWVCRCSNPHGWVRSAAALTSTDGLGSPLLQPRPAPAAGSAAAPPTPSAGGRVCRCSSLV